MNSTLDSSQLNVFSAFMQLLNWKQVKSIVDSQPGEGAVAAVITTRAGDVVSGYELHTYIDRSKTEYRVFNLRASNQVAFVKWSTMGGNLIAVVDAKHYNDFIAFAQTLDNE